LPSALPWRRENAELLHRPHGVKFAPGFGDLAIGDAFDPDTPDCHLLTRGRNAEEFTGV
jgi:hypothetical protein